MGKALPLYEETLAKRKAKLGHDHPDSLHSMNDLAYAYRAAGQLAKALPLYEETLTKRKARLGPDYPDTLDSMNNLAIVYLDDKQLAKAMPLFNELLAARRKQFGPPIRGSPASWLPSRLNCSTPSSIAKPKSWFANAWPSGKRAIPTTGPHSIPRRCWAPPC